MAVLAFIDTETVGLDPDRHGIWEVGLILRQEDGSEEEFSWQLPVDLVQADTIALNIGRFHERRLPTFGVVDIEHRVQHALEGKGGFVLHPNMMGQWAERFVRMTRGAHLVGAVVSFDAERLWRLLRSLGECPMWHYHIVDVEALAAGWLARDPDSLPVEPPWKSDALSRMVDVDPDTFDRHTALGDARWAMAIYDAVMGPQNRSE